MAGSRHLVVTVHGIQTFGRWADDLRHLLHATETPPLVLSYKYGLFSFLAFSIPFVRRRRVERFCKELKAWRDDNSEARLDIVAHSFGTYLVAHALLSDENLRVDTVILSGSVLEPDFPWYRLLTTQRVRRVVNECGDSDIPLIASQFLVWGTGMAGRLGFRAITGAGLTNRFYKGGHSLYFKRPGFMAARWVPLLTVDAGPVAEVDERDAPTAFRMALVIAAQNATVVKVGGYALVAVLILLWLRDYRDSTRLARARQLATYADVARDQQSAPALSGLIAIESLRVARTDEGERALRRTLSQLAVPLNRFRTFLDPPVAAIGDRTRNIAIVTHGSDVDIRRMSDGQEMNVLRHPDAIDTLAVSANGNLVVTAAGTWLYVWEARSARQIGRIPSRTPLRRLDVNSDGSRVLEVKDGADVDMRLYDVKSAKEIKHIELPDGGVRDTAFSVDGRLVAAAVEHQLFPQAGGIRVWDGLTGEAKPTLTREGNAVAVAISADSRWIAAGYASGTVLVWAVDGRREVQLNAGAPVRALTFSPTVISSDGVLTGKVAPEGTNGEWLASVAGDAVRVWDIASGAIRSFVSSDGPVEGIAFSPDAARFATLRSNSSWDMWRPISPFSTPPRHDARILAAAMSCHGDRLLTAGEDGALRAWDAATGRAIESNPMLNAFLRLEERFYEAVYVCDEQRDWLAAVPQFGLPLRSAVLVDTRMGVIRGTPLGQAISDMAASPDGRSLALGSESGTVTIWRVLEGSYGRPTLQSMVEYGGRLTALAVDSRGSTVAATGDHGVRIWSSSRGARSIDLPERTSSVSIDDAGRLVVVGSDDQKVRVIDLATGRIVRTIMSPGPIRAVQLRRDGAVVAIASTSVDVFLTATGETVGRIADARDVDSLFFTRDGRSLMTVTNDIAQEWLWNLDDLIAESCTRISRSLTEKEWQRYIDRGRRTVTCPGEPHVAAGR